MSVNIKDLSEQSISKESDNQHEMSEEYESETEVNSEPEPEPEAEHEPEPEISLESKVETNMSNSTELAPEPESETTKYPESKSEAETNGETPKANVRARTDARSLEGVMSEDSDLIDFNEIYKSGQDRPGGLYSIFILLIVLLLFG